MQTSLWYLQKALYNRLSNDIPLNDVITGIYDQVSEDATFPYITISEPEVTPFTSKNSYGENTTIVIHTWSQYAGKKESYDILNLILQSLSSSPIRLEGGFSLFRMETEQMQVITDIDGATQHGILRLRCWVNN
jgi:hypothetical protein